MLVVKSAHVQRWHLNPDRPVLIELQLTTQYGDNAGLVAALLSPALAEELGVGLDQLASSDFTVPVGS